MKYLLDTCILSEYRQAKPNPSVLFYIDGLNSLQVYISVVTVGEITKGVQGLEAGKRKQEFEQWLNVLESEYSGRILPITTDIARLWGELLAKAKRQGLGLPAIDGLIAATAMHHGLHLVTRNVSDFQATGALLINPWEV